MTRFLAMGFLAMGVAILVVMFFTFSCLFIGWDRGSIWTIRIEAIDVLRKGLVGHPSWPLTLSR